MQIHIQLFANLKERFDKDSISIQVDGPVTVEKLMESLKQLYPTRANDLNRVLVARNRVLAAPNIMVSEHDEIALIPPVGGGEDTESLLERTKISDSPLVVEQAYRLLEDANHGGTSLFVGTVREWTNGKQTSHLIYESYESMAIEQMTTIQREIELEFDRVTTLQWHRVGRLSPVDIAVICGASSPHRDMAFLACRKLIERLKTEVTIWKRESYTDGQSVWRENPENNRTDKL